MYIRLTCLQQPFCIRRPEDASSVVVTAHFPYYTAKPMSGDVTISTICSLFIMMGKRFNSSGFISEISFWDYFHTGTPVLM